MDFIDLVKIELKFQKHLYKQFDKLRRNKDKGKISCTIRPDGRKKYYITDESGRKYVHKKNPDEVRRLYKIQLKEISLIVIKKLEKNIRLLTELIDGYEPCNFFNIMETLPEKLKFGGFGGGPWKHIEMQHRTIQSEKPTRREELRHTTSFGLFTRSKNEAIIAEILHAAGIEFYYERRLTLRDEYGNYAVIYPDFTIITASGKAIYWEHKGLLSNAEYCEMDKKRMSLYFINGIFQPHNLIVTTDGPAGEFCGMEISMIVEKILMPLCKSRF